MNTNDQHITCDGFAAKLADLLEGDLPDAGRASMDSHASGCAECSALLAELGSLRMDAAALPLLEPSHDLWAGIAERIDTRVLPLDGPRGARVAAVRRTWRHPAVAAAALMLVTAGVTHVWTRNSLQTAAPSTTGRLVSGPVAVQPTVPTGESPAERMSTIQDQMAGAARVASTGSEPAADPGAPRVAARRAEAESRPAATLVSSSPSARRIMSTEVEPVYDREITKLRAIMRDRRAQLDPQTVAVLEQSIAVIDSAIAQSRAALAKDPASGFLATQLNHSLEKKVELLRTAALLPART
jgi:hypothetical protein